MLARMKRDAEVIRTNAALARRDGQTREAQHWERAARLLDVARLQMVAACSPEAREEVPQEA